MNYRKEKSVLHNKMIQQVFCWCSGHCSSTSKEQVPVFPLFVTGVTTYIPRWNSTSSQWSCKCLYEKQTCFFFFLLPRPTVPLDQSLKTQTWKGRTFKKITQVQWRIIFANPNLFVLHLLTPLSENATFSRMHFFGLPFQIQEIFHVLQG